MIAATGLCTVEKEYHMTTIMRASHEWATRPPDQRFLSLNDLRDSVSRRKQESWTATPALSSLRMMLTPEGELRVNVYDPSYGEKRDLAPTNWGFGQLAQVAKAPAAYLRSLPAELTAINLQWGLEHNPLREEGMLLAQSNGSDHLRAVTSTSYGRIWDLQVVDAVIRANKHGVWQIPAASYATQNPKRATTLYASDRDVFIFLVDPNHPIEVGGDTLFRGFMVWNSEVGAATFGLTTFLYRAVCDNRIVTGCTNIQELRIRHTSGAPDRFAYEGAKYLQRYAEESTVQTVRAIELAQNTDIPVKDNGKDTDRRDTVTKWLQERGFTQTEARGSVDAAVAEEGDVRSIWDIVNGITAMARQTPYTNDRVALETKAGKIMEQVAARV
jgi:Domain of unknown function (DUF932)